MKTYDIVSWLRDQAIRAPEDVLKRGMTQAVDKIEELARLKARSAAMECALKASGGCGNCKNCYVPWNEEPCDSCRQDPGFPKWEWNGNIRGWAK